MTTPFPFVAGQVLTAAQLNDIQNLPISDKTASYTLIASDVYKRTIMNNASATTITVNNSIFTVGDVIQVANKGAGACTITAGAGVTINSTGTLILAQYGGGYLLALSASTFTFFKLGAAASTTIDVDYLVVGGGGGGAAGDLNEGGGGAGGYLAGTGYKVPKNVSLTVTIGSGASGSPTKNVQNFGTTSRFYEFYAFGGGAGGGALNINAGSGGSGGGGSSNNVTNGGAGVSNQGNAGGNAGSSRGGGGGGSSAAGATGTASGNGGAGTSNSISGTSLFFSGGGGGAASSSPGTGGSGVGGNGGTSTGGNATANRGGGGGGGNLSAAGGNGGSGRVIVRTADTEATATTTGSPTVTTAGGYKVYDFTGSGTITFT